MGWNNNHRFKCYHCYSSFKKIGDYNDHVNDSEKHKIALETGKPFKPKSYFCTLCNFAMKKRSGDEDALLKHHTRPKHEKNIIKALDNLDFSIISYEADTFSDPSFISEYLQNMIDEDRIFRDLPRILVSIDKQFFQLIYDVTNKAKYETHKDQINRIINKFNEYNECTNQVEIDFVPFIFESEPITKKTTSVKKKSITIDVNTNINNTGDIISKSKHKSITKESVTIEEDNNKFDLNGIFEKRLLHEKEIIKENILTYCDKIISKGKDKGKYCCFTNGSCKHDNYEPIDKNQCNYCFKTFDSAFNATKHETYGGCEVKIKLMEEKSKLLLDKLIEKRKNEIFNETINFILKKTVKINRKSIPLPLKSLVWKKYIGEVHIKDSIAVGKCYCCQDREIDVNNFECGHIIAQSLGGRDSLENLRPICSVCNKSMGQTNMREFIEEHGFWKDKFYNI